MKKKGTWKELEGSFHERQKAQSKEECACGCGQFISNRSAKAKAKGTTGGYVKGHTWKNRELPEDTKRKLRDNHADVSGDKNPNYGKGLFGKKNPNWQGGKKEKYYKAGSQIGSNTKSDLAFRVFIRARDKQCIICGKKNQLTVHHIKPWVEAPELRFDPKNTVALCRSCHTRVDNRAYREMYKPLFKRYINSL